MATHSPWNVYAPPEVKERLNELVDKHRQQLTVAVPGATMPNHQVIQQALETAIYTTSKGATVNDPEYK